MVEDDERENGSMPRGTQKVRWQSGCVQQSSERLRPCAWKEAFPAQPSPAQPRDGSVTHRSSRCIRQSAGR